MGSGAQSHPAGRHQGWGTVVGLPGETRKTARASRVLPDHCDYAHSTVRCPTRDRAGREAASTGGGEADWTGMTSPAPPDLPDFSAERAEVLRRRAFVEFYFRPEVVWANLRRKPGRSSSVWTSGADEGL